MLGFSSYLRPTHLYYTRLNDIVLPKSTPEPVVDDGDGGPVMYTTESFEIWPPAGWTFLDMSAGQAGIGAEQSTHIQTMEALLPILMIINTPKMHG